MARETLLVSDAAHGLLAGTEIATTDKGPHALKGFDEPYRLWVVDATVYPQAAS